MEYTNSWCYLCTSMPIYMYYIVTAFDPDCCNATGTFAMICERYMCYCNYLIKCGCT